ncbi:MAG: phosphonate utilization associated transcriptional regulator [Firmicutes bacterium]|nr:phosphonate utilization associated transcriptional regulator [Bacillota bacterium]
MNKKPPATVKKQLAYEYIQKQIIDGSFGPGYRIVIDRIARELNLSTIPVREAIQQLEADGLVQIIPYSGAVVQLLNDNDYQEAMYVLSLLVGAATGLAAKNLTQADINELEEINEAIKEALSNFDFDKITELNRAFHDIIADKCGNVYLAEKIKQTFQRIFQVVRAGFSLVPQRAKDSAEEHDVILRMIREAVPPEEIEKYVRQHTLNMLTAVQGRKAALQGKDFHYVRSM